MNAELILEQFCKKIAVLGYHVFPAMDADIDSEEKPKWITLNGTHINLEDGETPKEAGERFARTKEVERQIKEKKPALIGYEWRSKLGEKYSAHEEGLVPARVSDWDNHAVSEISNRKIVHVYFIRDENGEIKPYGKESAMKKLGYRDNELKQKIQPYIKKAMRDKKVMDDLLKDYLRRIENGNIHYNGLSAANSNPYNVYRFGQQGVVGKGTMSNNAVFVKLPKNNYAVFFAGIDGRPEKQFVEDMLTNKGFEIISWKDMKKLTE